MSVLLGPNGLPISSYKRETPKALGPAFGQWSGRDVILNQAPGGAIFQFDLNQLGLADFRAMRGNPQINANLSVLSFMIHQADWRIECSDKKMAQKMDDILRPHWTRLVRGLSQALWAGFSPVAIDYENNIVDRSVGIDKLKDLLPEECTVHWKQIEGAWAPPGRDKPKLRIYDGINQAGFPFPIPAENTMWYPLLMENGDMQGRKLLKAAFGPWYFSTLMHLFANRYYERFGEPTPIGRANFEDTFPTSDGTSISGKQAMEGIIANLRNRGVVVLPNTTQPLTHASTKAVYDYDIEYLESQMRGADFERYMSRLDEEMSMAMFTPILLMRTSDVGSHNLGVQHTQTWLWCLNALTGDMKEYIDRYIIQRLKEYNFGKNAPRIEWMPKKLGKENVETLRGIIVELIRGGTVKPSLDQLGEALGMTLQQVKVVTQLTPPVDPNAPPADPNAPPVNPNVPPVDKRGPRNKPKSSGPKGVGEPRATGRQVSARIAGQIENAFKNKTFDGTFRPDFGYKRRFIQSLVAEGFDSDLAEQITDDLYARLTAWVTDAVAIGQSEFTSAKDFMAMFDRVLDMEIDSLVEYEYGE